MSRLGGTGAVAQLVSDVPLSSAEVVTKRKQQLAFDLNIFVLCLVAWWICHVLVIWCPMILFYMHLLSITMILTFICFLFMWSIVLPSKIWGWDHWRREQSTGMGEVVDGWHRAASGKTDGRRCRGCYAVPPVQGALHHAHFTRFRNLPHGPARHVPVHQARIQHPFLKHPEHMPGDIIAATTPRFLRSNRFEIISKSM